MIFGKQVSPNSLTMADSVVHPWHTSYRKTAAIYNTRPQSMVR